MGAWHAEPRSIGAAFSCTLLLHTPSSHPWLLHIHRCATHVDGTIGALIDAVDALGLRPTTALIVHGDHGYSLGQHGRWSKYNVYEDATRVPLIIAVPQRPGTQNGGVVGHSHGSRSVDDIVESLDVMESSGPFLHLASRNACFTSCIHPSFTRWYVHR